MKFYTAGRIKEVLSYLSDEVEITEDGLNTFLAPFGDERYFDCNEWRLHEEGLEPTRNNVKAQVVRQLIDPKSVMK